MIQIFRSLWGKYRYFRLAIFFLGYFLVGLLTGMPPIRALVVASIVAALIVVNGKLVGIQ